MYAARLRLMALVAGAGTGTVMLAGLGCERELENDAAASKIIRMPPAPPVIYELIPELVLGSRDGTPPDGFGNVVSIAVNSAGDIAVFDGFDYRITVFGPDGGYVRHFGGHGSGPGELEDRLGMAMDRHDTLWLVEPEGYERFTFDGRALGLIDRHVRGIGLPWRPVFDTDNHVIDGGIRLINPVMSLLDRRESGDGLGRTRFTPARQDPVTGAITFFRPIDTKYELLPGGTPSPDRPDFKIALDPMGFVWVNEGLRYSVEKRTFDGHVLFRIVGPDHPIPMSLAARESVAAGYRGHPSQVRLSDVPREVRVIARIQADRLGRLMVFRNPRPGDPGTIIDLFDPSGSYLGQVRSDEWQVSTGVVPVLREDILYFVAKDDLDVPFVVRARLAVLP